MIIGPPILLYSSGMINSNKTLGIATEVNEAEYNTSEKSTDSEVLEDDEKIDASSGFD
jgi:hypothetical protein